jgi:hypothetical protein
MTSAPPSLEPGSSVSRTGPVTIFVVSDSSGETAAHVTQAALAQFQAQVATIQRYPQIRSSSQLVDVISDAAKCEALVAYTLVLPEFRETLVRETRRWNVDSFDLLGPLISKIAQLTRTSPMSQPGRLHVLDDAYFRRMEAVNFAVHLDDGTHPDRLHEADVVLVGLSRSSKTPNCLYLAQHYGLKSANVPLVVGIAPPPALRRIDPRKVFGLSIDPHVLHGLRSSRAQVMGIDSSQNYSSLEELVEEVKYARQIFRELKCQVIDVSTRAIEETSSEIALRLSRVIGSDQPGGKL